MNKIRKAKCWQLLKLIALHLSLYFCIIKVSKIKTIFLNQTPKFYFSTIPHLCVFAMTQRAFINLCSFLCSTFSPTASIALDSLWDKTRRYRKKRKHFQLAGATCNSFSVIDYGTLSKWPPTSAPVIPTSWCSPLHNLLPHCTRVGIEQKKNDDITILRLDYKTHVASILISPFLSLLASRKVSCHIKNKTKQKTYKEATEAAF